MLPTKFFADNFSNTPYFSLHLLINNSHILTDLYQAVCKKTTFLCNVCARIFPNAVNRIFSLHRNSELSNLQARPLESYAVVLCGAADRLLDTILFEFGNERNSQTSVDIRLMQSPETYLSPISSIRLPLAQLVQHHFYYRGTNRKKRFWTVKLSRLLPQYF